MACECGRCVTWYGGGVLQFLPAGLRRTEKVIEESIGADPRPLFLGFYTMREWNDHKGLFVFKCRGCRAVQRAFACFNPGNEHPVVHFHCAYCDFDQNFAKFPQTYDEVGLPRTPGGLSPMIEHLRDPICPRAAGSHS